MLKGISVTVQPREDQCYRSVESENKVFTQSQCRILSDPKNKMKQLTGMGHRQEQSLFLK